MPDHSRAAKVDALVAEIGKLGIDAVGEAARILVTDPIRRHAVMLTELARKKRIDVQMVDLQSRDNGWTMVIRYGHMGYTRINIRLLGDALPRLEGWLIRVGPAGRPT